MMIQGQGYGAMGRHMVPRSLLSLFMRIKVIRQLVHTICFSISVDLDSECELSHGLGACILLFLFSPTQVHWKEQ